MEEKDEDDDGNGNHLPSNGSDGDMSVLYPWKKAGKLIEKADIKFNNKIRT